jgi:hypothetical protein
VTVTVGSLVVKCRALFDTGSQKTFIHSDLASQLGLPISYRLNLCVDGFGSRGVNQPYNVVTLSVQSSEGPIDIDAVVTDSLPNKLTMLRIYMTFSIIIILYFSVDVLY